MLKHLQRLNAAGCFLFQLSQPLLEIDHYGAEARRRLFGSRTFQERELL